MKNYNCNSIDEYASYLTNITYEYFYISFGSKYNENFVYIKNKDGKQNTKFTNATEQLIPIFYRGKKNTLIVCIDRFTPVELEKNKTKIQDIESDNSIILYNSDATIQSIEKFIRYMINYFVENKIPPEKVFIANYVRYITPNHTENYLENNIPNVIYKCLNTCKTEKYYTRFFQWFGYQENTYNLLYNYNGYKHLFGYNDILTILNDVYNEDCLSYSNLYMILEIKNKVKTLYLEIFLKNAIDINSDTEMSLYDYFYESSPYLFEYSPNQRHYTI